MPRPSPGPNLEWHGASIRVSIGIPKALRHHYDGKARIKEPLGTDSPREARTLALPHIARIKSEFAQLKKGLPLSPRGAMSLQEEAKAYRDAINSAPTAADQEALEYALYDRVEALRGPELASDNQDEPEYDPAKDAIAAKFYGIATGTRTPIETFLDEFHADRHELTRATRDRYVAAVRGVVAWLENAGRMPCLETFTARDAADYLTAQRDRPKQTVGAIRTGAAAYWTWLRERRRIAFESVNPWHGQRVVGRPPARSTGDDDDDDNARPFTDAEVAKLFQGIDGRRMPQYLPPMMKIAALSGLRLNEIAYQKVRYLKDGEFRVFQSFAKTPASVRSVPIHTDLLPLVAELCRGKGDNDYLIDGLRDRDRMTDTRRRGAPASQAFTRYRRSLGIADGNKDHRNDPANFHSFRRWFIDKATSALENGESGFALWVIKDVVGHDRKSDITTGLYAGPRSTDAKRACVEAVRLPEAATAAPLTPKSRVGVTSQGRRQVTTGTDRKTRKVRKRKTS